MDVCTEMESPAVSECERRDSDWKNRCLDMLSQFKRNIEEAGIHERTSDLLNRKQEIEKNLKLKEEECANLTNEVCKLELDCQKKQNASYRSEVKLYESISKLEWDLECPPNELKGAVLNDRIRTFHLDSTQHSEYFITNHLWKLIEGNDE